MLSTLDAAQEYHSRGWVVVSISPGTKHPPSKGWQNQRLSPPEFPAHFNNGAGVGLVLGTPSGGLVDVDLDCPEAIEAARYILPKTERLHGRTSKPCSHWWFRVATPTPATEQFADIDGVMLAELRGTGGQTIVPPTLNPEDGGEVVSWELDGEPAEAAWDDLKVKVAGVAAVSLLARHWPQAGSRHAASLALAGVLARAGRTNAPRFIQLVAKIAGDDEAPLRGKDAETTLEKLKDGEAVSGWPVFVETFGADVAKRLRKWLRLPEDDPIAGLNLDGLVAKDVPSLVLPLTSLGDLYDEDDDVVPWLAEGLLPGGGLSLFASKPKVGKSTLVRTLCATVACEGRQWLGVPVAHGTVVYLGIEEKRDEVKAHFRGLGVPHDAPVRVFTQTKDQRLPPDAMARLEATVEQEKPILLVIDGLYRLLRAKDSNSYAEITNRLDPLLTLCRATGVHIAMTHHERKDVFNLDGQDGVLGSTALVGSVDVTFVLRRERGTGRRLIQSTSRYGEDFPETVLILSESGEVSLGGSRQQEDEHILQERILRALDGAGEPLPREGCNKSIEGLVEGRYVDVSAALSTLLANEQVFRAGSGKRGDPYLYTAADLEGVNSPPEKRADSPPESPPKVSPPTPVGRNGRRNATPQQTVSQAVTADEAVSPPVPPRRAKTASDSPPENVGGVPFTVPGEDEALPAGTVGHSPTCDRDSCEGGCVQATKIPAATCKKLGVPATLKGGAEAMSLEVGGDCSWCGHGPGCTLAYSDTLQPVCVPCASKLLPPDPFAEPDTQ